MAASIKSTIHGFSVFRIVSLLSALAFFFQSCSGITKIRENEANSVAIPGRWVQIDGKEYREAFRLEKGAKLGDCATRFSDGIKTCSEKFGGDVIFIPKGSTVVDVSRVQSSEDILSHIMGGIGISVGVLGLASVSAKVNVAVTTKTNAMTLNLMSSYDLQRGLLTLHNAHPLTPVGTNGTLFLSEIQLGGSELLLVNIEFESESKRTQVEIAVKIKILFITISAKMKYIKETFKTASSVEIHFVSSWRGEQKMTFNSLDLALPEVERLEEFYVTGPSELSTMDKNDIRLHNLYSFASWNRGPYGTDFNAAAIHSDLKMLTDQNTEVTSVLNNISEAYKQGVYKDQERELKGLEKILKPMREKLMITLNNYHLLNEVERSKLQGIYGVNIPPLHYQRKFRHIMNAQWV